MGGRYYSLNPQAPGRPSAGAGQITVVAAATAAAATASTTTSGTDQMQMLDNLAQWPFAVPTQPFSFSGATSNSQQDLARWPAPHVSLGRCSTFATADVRRALRAASKQRRRRDQSGGGCHFGLAARAKPLASLPATKFKSALAARAQATTERPQGLEPASSPLPAGRQLVAGRRHTRAGSISVGHLNWLIIDNDTEQDKQTERLSELCLAAQTGNSIDSNLDTDPARHGQDNTLDDKTNQPDNRQRDLLHTIDTCDCVKQNNREAGHTPSSNKILAQYKPIDDDNTNTTMSQHHRQVGPTQSAHLVSMQLDHHRLRGASSQADLAATIGGLGAPDDGVVVECRNGTSLASIGQQQSLSSVSLSATSSSSAKFSRLVGKKASRVKELLLQNLGRADKTTDELFELYEENFFKQQAQANKIAKEFKNYLNSLRNFHEAKKSLNNCIQQSTSDYQSARHDLVCENLTQLEQLNEDLLEKLHEQVLQNVGEYLSKFDELKDKIAKRHRKLIDYDSSRRSFEILLNQISKKRLRSVQKQQQQQQQQQHSSNEPSSSSQASQFPRGLRFLAQQQQSSQQQNGSAASQLLDEARLLKLREQFNYCKIMYETINSELHDELPVVYEKKMKSLLMTLQNYFALEAHYHSNASKLFVTTSDVIDELPELTAASLVMRRRQQQLQQQASEDNQAPGRRSDRHGQLRGAGQTTGGSAEPGSGDELFADTSHDQKATGSSSGMGSSRGDSSSCLDSSAAGSPDSAAGSADEPAGDEEAGKTEGPADVLQPSAGEQEPARQAGGTGAIVCEPPEVANEPETGHQAEGRQVTIAAEPAEPACGDAPLPPRADDERDDDQDDDDQVGPQPADDQTGGPIIGGATGLAPLKHEDAAVLTVSRNNEDGELCLYKVKTNYKYLAEDVDELCFEADEIIQVIEFDESHEPEEGWLMGIREVNGQRGLFPANFTRPI